MCGIAGFTRFADPMGDKASLTAMGKAMAHRGPDASGTYLDQEVGLVHRRLSIIDLSPAGNQPMQTLDGELVICFNGEIYNFRELREELREKGHRFRSETDTEVILALYREHGEDCLEHLNGMFAFALWDRPRRRLFLARDRIGKKPLYYFHQDGRFAFASELKSLLTLPGIPREVRPDAVYDFFAYQYVPDPKTIFRYMHKLPPGHCMTVTRDGLAIRRYWEIRFTAERQDGDDALARELRETLTRCTRQRMISDVPLGAFLSGGVDSSGVVALMAGLSEGPVKTCSIGFDEEKYNETEFAREVAEKYATEHHEMTVHENVKDHLEEIVGYFDEPFADPSLVPTYFVSALARRQVTVAVSGDGGDEVFAGYEKYSIDAVENRLRRLFPRWVRRHLFPPLAALLGRCRGSLCRRGSSLLRTLSVDPALGFYLSNTQLDDRHWNRLITPAFREQLGDYHPAHITTEAYAGAEAPDHLSRILYTDMKTYLPGGILVKVDRMSMANSLEVRSPILDRRVIEFACRLPSRLKLAGGQKKILLRKAFEPLLPAGTLTRRKMGFSVPLASWLRTELREVAEDYLFGRRGGIARYFDLKTLRDFWDRHQSGEEDHADLLWNMLMFQMWWCRYMPADAGAGAEP